MLKGAVDCCWASSLESERMETRDSTLAERPGTSLRLGLDLANSIVGVVVWLCCGWGSQQSVSRFHNRQVRFSSRRPSSIDSAHFENTTTNVSMSSRRAVPLTTYYCTSQRGVRHSSCPALATCPHPPRASGFPIGSASGIPMMMMK